MEKKIIQRSLPLNVNYSIVDKKYVPLLEGYGCTCDNCGRLIANIATVSNPDGDKFSIGFDCLETFLINNKLISGLDVLEYEKVKKMIPKVLNIAKHVRSTIELNRQRGFEVVKLNFDEKKYESNFFVFYWHFDRAKPLNSYFKIKDMDFDFLVSTLKNIFPKIEFTVGEENFKKPNL